MNSDQQALATWRRARELLASHRHRQALGLFEELTKVLPNSGQLHLELAETARGLGELGRAVSALRRAVELAGKDLNILKEAGLRFSVLGFHREASQCFKGALKRDSASGEAALGLVRSLDRLGKIEMADRALRTFEQATDDSGLVDYLKGFRAIRRGDVSSGERLLRSAITKRGTSGFVPIAAGYLLANTLDKAGDYEAAMRTLLATKQRILQAQNLKPTWDALDQGTKERASLLKSFTRLHVERWQQQPSSEPAPDMQLAFLGGHPRSGTTLLETVLDRHSAIAAYDETDAFEIRVDQFFSRFGPNHADINRLPVEYQRHLTCHAPPPEGTRVLIDKNPSFTYAIHTWLRTFPGIKVMIALRHPLDVILSSFFLDIQLNVISANFVTLERLSAHYRGLMDVWLRFREIGGFSWAESRYEDMVHDPVAEGKRLTGFLGLEWQDGQLEGEKQLSQTRAPTYHDARQEVHARSLERWRNYREHLEPIIPGLERYFEAFDYNC